MNKAHKAKHIAMIKASAESCAMQMRRVLAVLPTEIEWENVNNMESLLKGLQKTLNRELENIAQQKASIA